MKKLGTPIGAGPGSDSEKVGLVADGTPFPDGRFECLCFATCAPAAGLAAWGWVDGFCALAGLPVFGVGGVPGDEVEVELEVDVEELELVDEELGLEELLEPDEDELVVVDGDEDELVVVDGADGVALVPVVLDETVAELVVLVEELVLEVVVALEVVSVDGGVPPGSEADARAPSPSARQTATASAQLSATTR